MDLLRSPVEGPAGNIEFLIWLRFGLFEPAQTLDESIEQVLA